jgi:FixJ family two-component response regulator
MRIIILDDDAEVLSLLKDVLLRAMPDAEIITHQDHREFLDNPHLYDADLYIIDVLLSAIDGLGIFELLPPECRSIPALYISGIGDTSMGKSPGFKRLVREQPYIEFIAKPISIDLFINRVLLLLRASGRSSDTRLSEEWRQMIEKDRARINEIRKACGLKTLNNLMVCGQPIQVKNG